MIIVPGPVQVYAGSAICKAPSNSDTYNISDLGLVRLGQTEAGVNVSISNRAHRVNVDDMGGAQGSPADLIYLGSSAAIRGTLVDYGDPSGNSVSASVKKALWGISRGLRITEADNALNSTVFEGDIVAPGTPLFDSGYGFSLLLVGVKVVYLFPKCEFASNPREWNVSSMERRTSFTVSAYEIPVVGAANDFRRLYYNAISGTVGSNAYDSCRTTIHTDLTAS